MMDLETDAAIFEDTIVEDSDFENEKCGICMDIIIDRGVLDCCHHWFCFACIDNWATITNLCPLCQNEFQLITCLPVYDTIGTPRVDDSLTRDDDWFIRGTNNTLSFPSYYIDENAVICLDGDGCTIRNGTARSEDDSNLDTSIACDSCDKWYHAFCVGFDPASTSDNSWLCPRCAVDEAPPNLDGALLFPGNRNGTETASHECMDDGALSAKLSVSIADTGETAVVVSMIEGKQRDEEATDDFLSVLDINCDRQTINRKNDIELNVEQAVTSLTLYPSQDSHTTLSSDSLPLTELKASCADKEVSEPKGSTECNISAHLLSNIPNTESEPPGCESNVDLHLGLFVGSLPVDKMGCGESENHISVVSQLHNSSEELSPSGDKMELDGIEDAIGFTGVKRKSMCSRLPVTQRDHILMTEDIKHDDIYTKNKMVFDVPVKKAKFDRKSQKTPLKHETRNSLSRSAPEDNCLPAGSHKLEEVHHNKYASSDIMSIVRGIDHKPSLVSLSTSDKSSNGRDSRENGIGVRVKKIMRRAPPEDESSKIVENLRKEIREAVRNKAAPDFSKSKFFDPKLLTAFRAAIAGPRAEQEPVKKLNPSVVRAKKSMLQKGKARENLTKKIYGTTNGRRRRAWDRDWEIEFWKHRCKRITQPEKVETLKSVLDLLRRGSQSSNMEQDFDDEAASPILSRLYLADTSVFPRKDDIKPLSSLTQSSRNPSQVSSRSSHEVKRGDALDIKGEATGVHPHCSATLKSSASMSSSSKVNSQHLKEMPGKLYVKTDKRKWALEVLARKNATVERVTQGKQEDDNFLKGNFPLLAQLPTDMKPVLAPSRHNKVPTSVRQAQLFRLTEHLLKKANLPVIRRTADTELAVADAVNIEKEIADRSNSKLVYVNLCSQVLSKHLNNNRTTGAMESNPSLVVLAESTELPTKELPSDLSAEEALKLAGLVSDSPPDSPLIEHLGNEDSSLVRTNEDVTDNLFDIDTHGDLDIYGDFEYDLDDEDYVGGNVLKASKTQLQEGDSRMKLLFSTINTERTNDSLGLKDKGRLGYVKAPVGSPGFEFQKGGDIDCSTVEAREDTSCPETDPEKEPYLIVCEELYGPEKELLVVKYPDKASEGLNIAPFENVNDEPDMAVGSELLDESSAENMSVRSRLPIDQHSSGAENSPNHFLTNKNDLATDNKTSKLKQSDTSRSIFEKVEAYIKEHIRPLCKSGVITVDQYRWAVGKTSEKIMKYHSKEKNANFLIKEGEKVKKLAQQYVEAAQKKMEGS